jgi:ribosomal protein L31
MTIVVGKANINKRATCRSCASILEYLPIDVKEASHTDYTGCTDIVKWIDCPNCGRSVNVN